MLLQLALIRNHPTVIVFILIQFCGRFVLLLKTKLITVYSQILMQ
jgi:hypothetical protein